MRPDIRIIGVQTERFPAAWAAMHGEERPCALATIADGIGVKSPGALTLPLIRRLVDDVVLVGEDDIEQAILMLLEIEKTVVEGAGAAVCAAFLSEPARFKGRRVGLVLCGGNIDPRLLSTVMVRELERESRITSFRLAIPDRPGILGHVATLFGDLGANILEVDHRRLFLDVPAKGAKLDVTVELRGRAHSDEIFARLQQEGYAPVRIEAATAMD